MSETDEDAERLREVIAALARAEDDRATRLLAPIAGQTILQTPIRRREMKAGIASPDPTGARTRNPPRRVLAGVFWRDAFTCSYCRRRTVPPDLMALVSRCCPVAFPHHPHWRRDATHRLYWDISTSVDHVHAVSSGGSWNDPRNLATACARCQYQKGCLPLEALGWTRHAPARSWDGAVTHYRGLWERCGRPPGRFAAWIQAYEAQRPAG